MNSPQILKSHHVSPITESSLYNAKAAAKPTNVVKPKATRLFPAPANFDVDGEAAGAAADGELGAGLLPVLPLVVPLALVPVVELVPFVVVTFCPGIVLSGAVLANSANFSTVLPVLGAGLDAVSHLCRSRVEVRRGLTG